MIKKSFCEASHSHNHSHLILDPGSAYYDDVGGGFAPSEVIIIRRSGIQDQVAVAVGIAVAVAVAVDFVVQVKNFLTKVLNFDFSKVLNLHSAF